MIIIVPSTHICYSELHEKIHIKHLASTCLPNKKSTAVVIITIVAVVGCFYHLHPNYFLREESVRFWNWNESLDDEGVDWEARKS